jgi:TrmH family RNA methyltransferase
MFLVEGVQPINVALAKGWEVATLVYESGATRSGWATDVIARTPAAERYELSPDLFRRLSRKDEPSELLAVLLMPDDSLERIRVDANLLVVVVDRPGNPGNLGTLIRSGDSFGANGVIVSGHGVDVYDPATVTASRGSLFAVPVVRVQSHEDVTRWVSAVRTTLGGCRIVGTDERAPIEVSQSDLVGPTVLVLGNETHGLSRAYRELCEELVSIPMVGSATSLNVSVAASIVLYEAVRQRRLRRRPGASRGTE